MSNFTFKLSSNIILGSYSIAKIGSEAAQFGKKFLFVVDPLLHETGIAKKVIDALEQRGISVLVFDGVKRSADSDIIENALNIARGVFVDAVIASGGIGPVAVGRAVASLYNETGSIYDFIEGKPCTAEPLPFIEVPATCREPFTFTLFSPIVDVRSRKIHLLKVRHDLCKLCVFDTACYSNLAPNATVATILQGVGIAFEGYTSSKTNFLSETILGKAIDRFLQSLNPQQGNPLGTSCETVMAEAACLTAIGTSFSSPGLGSAITLACAARYNISSSVVGTIILPHLLSNAKTSNLDKLVKIGRMLEVNTQGVDALDIAQETIEEIRRRLAQANLPTRLKDINLSIEQLIAISEDAVSLSFMNYIPKPMRSDDIFELLKQAY
ncbi:MAG: iron-containing alcohol dehydrogenase [Treponema sp.]|uniref:iron-containing alcohol dehydrogenase n=1 Tax=Treponema sp. TaxID=166 RepID=UPI003FA1F942